MPNKVLSRPKVTESQGRNAFDRSGSLSFNQSAGMIVPVFMEPCIAGTKGVINRQVFTRSAQVVSPAFPDVKQCFDFFKVPIRLLMSAWNDWKLNINDLNSSAIVKYASGNVPDLSLPSSIPFCNFGDAAQRIYYYMNAQSYNATQITLFLNNFTRLFEGLGYGKIGTYSGTPGTAPSSVNDLRNLLPIAAYQKIYYDHYRNTTYESNNPYAYNLDWLYNTTNQELSLSSAAGLQQFVDMFTLRYVNRRNDYYQNIYPSLAYSQSTPNGSTWHVPSTIQGLGVNSQSGEGEITHLSTGATDVFYRTAVPTSMRVSAQSLRALFAFDKLLRASAYTPKHVRNQFLARFGVDVGDKVSNESERIGSFEHTIQFGEVTNTAATSNNPLGEVGGKGVGAQGFEKDIHFYCEEDSLIIGVSYIIPRSTYDSMYDEYTMNLVREDFYQPEFENLGLRPLYKANGTSIRGYTVPNQRYKLGRDWNRGLFNQSFPVFAISNGSAISTNGTGNLASFVVHSEPFDSTPTQDGVSLDYFKVRPSDLDPIFDVAYDSTYGRQEYDHFYYNVRFKFAVTQGMSVHGQPRL